MDEGNGCNMYFSEINRFDCLLSGVGTGQIFLDTIIGMGDKYKPLEMLISRIVSHRCISRANSVCKKSQVRLFKECSLHHF